MDKLGIFLSVSLYFVVATLVEFALVLFVKIYNEQRKDKIRCEKELSPLGYTESLNDIALDKWKRKALPTGMGLAIPKDKEQKNSGNKEENKDLLEISLFKIDKYDSELSNGVSKNVKKEYVLCYISMG